jgi:hypothetical protein
MHLGGGADTAPDYRIPCYLMTPQTLDGLTGCATNDRGAEQPLRPNPSPDHSEHTPVP